jgi:hypothetical protein
MNWKEFEKKTVVPFSRHLPVGNKIHTTKWLDQDKWCRLFTW